MDEPLKHTAPPIGWDYSALAAHYALRAPYSRDALDALFSLMRLPPTSGAVDIGAGTGRLTAALVTQGWRVTAVEPNAAMREIGSRCVPGARWIATAGQATGLPDPCAAAVTFGSSFNVLPAGAALDESARLLESGGWLVCLWNHRDLDDPLQAGLQRVIEACVPEYSHGSRRDDPGAAITAHGAYDDIHCLTGRVSHALRAADFVEGFRAHATLVRQAGVRMPNVLAALAASLAGHETLVVPFTTRIFAARRAHA